MLCDSPRRTACISASPACLCSRRRTGSTLPCLRRLYTVGADRVLVRAPLHHLPPLLLSPSADGEPKIHKLKHPRTFLTFSAIFRPDRNFFFVRPTSRLFLNFFSCTGAHLDPYCSRPIATSASSNGVPPAGGACPPSTRKARAPVHRNRPCVRAGNCLTMRNGALRPPTKRLHHHRFR